MPELPARSKGTAGMPVAIPFHAQSGIDRLTSGTVDIRAGSVTVTAGSMDANITNAVLDISGTITGDVNISAGTVDISSGSITIVADTVGLMRTTGGTIGAIVNPLNQPSGAEHFSGTVLTTPVTISLGQTSKYLLVDNLSLLNLLISFDGGTNWYTIGKYRSLSNDISISSFMLKNDGSIALEASLYSGVSIR